MGIGTEVCQYNQDPFTRALYRVIGLRDLHTHLRLRPMLEHLPPLLPKQHAEIVEFGCGTGINLFELAKLRRDISCIGYDLDEKAVDRARGVQRRSFPNFNASFHCTDVTRLRASDRQFDCILMMDLLEHIEEDRAFCDFAAGLLKPGGLLCISVPTHRYDGVFGQEFHERLGHVRSGYTIEELTRLLPEFDLRGAWYSTGKLAQVGCSLFYRDARRCPRVFRSALKSVTSLLFRWLDPGNGPDVSCSLFAIFVKRPG